MTEIEQKALALLDEVCAERGLIGGWHKHARETHTSIEALCRAIEQHEAFRKEVSDAVEPLMREWPEIRSHIVVRLSEFILPKPKPDPLVEAIDDLKDGRAGGTTESYAACLRAALAKRGLEVREIEG